MFQRDHPKLSISQQCKLVSFSRSAYYYTPVRIDVGTLEIMKEIDRVFTTYPFFESRQITAYLRRGGTVVRRHRVRRLMAKMGLEAIYKRPRTSQLQPQHPVYANLLRTMPIDRPNHVWCADITFVPVKNDFLYLLAIMDWATRNVLSWRLSNTMHADFCVEALKAAIYLEEISDGFQARRVVKNWTAFYNTRRPHSTLGRQTPDDAYLASLEERHATQNPNPIHLSKAAKLFEKVGPLQQTQ